MFETEKNPSRARVSGNSCINELIVVNFYLFTQGFKPPMLIFVQSRERAKELFHELIYDGINVDVIHSDRTQAQVRFL